jgi:hypothetical protein
MIESISAITLATHDMSRAVRFYACWDLRSFMAAMMRHSPASGPERNAGQLPQRLKLKQLT